MGAHPPPWNPHQGLWVWLPQHPCPLQKPTTPAPTSLRPLTVSRSTGAVSGSPRRHQNPHGPRLHSQACLRRWHQIPQAWDQEDGGKGLPQARCLWRPSFPHNPVCPQSNSGSLRLWSTWKGLQTPPHSKLKWSCETLRWPSQQHWVQIPPPQVCGTPCYMGPRGCYTQSYLVIPCAHYSSVYTHPGEMKTRPLQRSRTDVPRSVTHDSRNMEGIQPTIRG